MAEELGSAVLTLTAQDEGLNAALTTARAGLDAITKQSLAASTALNKVFNRDYRLKINDSQLVAANIRLDSLAAKLQDISSKAYEIRLNYVESGGPGGGGRSVDRQAIQRRAEEAMRTGLSGRMQDILAADVGASRTSSLRQTLLSRLDRKSLKDTNAEGVGGYNVPGVKEIIRQLGGAPTGKKREELVAQARQLITSVDDAVINEIGQNLVDLQMMLSPRGGGGSGGGRRSGLSPRADSAGYRRRLDLLSRLSTVQRQGLVDPGVSRSILAEIVELPQGRFDAESSRTNRRIERRLRSFEPAPPPRPGPPPPTPPTPPRRPPGTNIAEREQLAAERAQRQLASKERLQKKLKGANERISGSLSSGLIGGGFPLLFGQGAGASIGGGIAGLAGGALGGGFGFALSVVGTAIGAAFDQTLEKGKTLAAGLNDPIGQFDALRQASLLSSGAIERQAAALIASGREGEAAALIQLDIAKRYGDTSDLDKLRSASDELNRAFGEAGIAVAQFVAGPLADFLRRIAATTTAFVQQPKFEARLNAASPEAKARVEELRQRRIAETRGSGKNVIEETNRFRAEALQLIDETDGKTKEVLAAEAKSNAAKKANLANEKLSYQLIDASVDGYKQQTLEVQKQQLVRERNDKIFNLPENRTQADIDIINKQYAPQIYAVEKQLLSAKQERLATQFELNAQNAIELGALQRQITAAKTLATVSVDSPRTRSELQRRQQLQEAIAASRDRERSLGASIDAARLRGGDAGEQEAARLVEQQKLAAETTRLKLIEGADALRQAGKALNEDLTSAVLKLTEIRSSPDGLNRFLSPAAQQRRAEQDFQTLLPQFRQAQEKFRGLTGAAAPEFSGSFQAVNEEIRKFVTSVKTEFDATNGVTDIQKALSDNTAALAQINARLAGGTEALAAKDWNVYVNAPGATVSGAALGGVS